MIDSPSPRASQQKTAAQHRTLQSGPVEVSGNTAPSPVAGGKTAPGLPKLPEDTVQFMRARPRQEHPISHGEPRAGERPTGWLLLAPGPSPAAAAAVAHPPVPAQPRRPALEGAFSPEAPGGVAGSGRRQPARVVELRVAGGNSETVAVHVRQRSGELQVTVRAPDEALAGSLRSGLPELVNRLEQRGYEAQVWQPAAAGVADSAGLREPGSADRGSDGGFGDGAGQQGAHGEGEGRRHPRHDRRAWAEATQAFGEVSRTGGADLDDRGN